MTNPPLPHGGERDGQSAHDRTSVPPWHEQRPVQQPVAWVPTPAPRRANLIPLAVGVVTLLLGVAVAVTSWGVRTDLFSSALKPATGQVLPETLAETVRDHDLDVDPSDTEQTAAYLLPGSDDRHVYLRLTVDEDGESISVRDQEEFGNAAHTDDYGAVVCFEVFDDEAGYCAMDLDGGRMDISGDDVPTDDQVRLIRVAYGLLHA